MSSFLNREEERKRRREQQKRFRQGLSSSIIPEEIMNYVWEENRVFLTEKYAHDDDFLKVRCLAALT